MCNQDLPQYFRNYGLLVHQVTLLRTKFNGSMRQSLHLQSRDWSFASEEDDKMKNLKIE